MQDEQFTVKYITVNTCFAYLPAQWLKKLSSRPYALKLRYNGVDYYLSASPRPSPSSHDSSDSLCLSATFAKTLSIKEDSEIFVTRVEEAPELTSLSVSPKSSQDREIVELQCDCIQENLLNQISVVAKEQTIVAWISKHMSVELTVTSLEPDFKYGRLVENTEIHVGDALSKAISPAKVTKPSSRDINITNNISESILDSLNIPNIGFQNRIHIFRVHPIPKIFGAPFRVYMSNHHLPADFGNSKLCWLYKIKQDVTKSSSVSFTKTSDCDKKIAVEIFMLEDLIEIPGNLSKEDWKPLFKHPSIFVSDDFLTNTCTNVGSKIMLEAIQNISESKCVSLEIFSYEAPVSEEDFCDYIHRNSENSKILLSSKCTVKFEDGTRCYVKFSPENCSYEYFDKTSLREIDIRVNENSAPEDNKPAEEFHDDINILIKNIDFNDRTSPLYEMVSEALKALTHSLGLYNFMLDFEYTRENILVSGATGSGKTTVCKLLCSRLSKPPFFVHTRYIDCRFLKGKKADIIQKLLNTEVSHAVYYQPSILFLDNIESVTSVNVNTDENSPDAMNAARITDIIFNIITKYQMTNYFVVVATCTNANNIGNKLRKSRGVHFFGTILAIPSLTKEDRIKILRSSLEEKLYVLKEIDWDYYGNKTESWVAQDLVVLADKAAFTAWKRHVSEKSQDSLMLRESDLSETLSRCTPMSLHGVNLYKGAGHSWSEIGGLTDIKSTLIEILHWPLKYPEIFKKAPIKLQSGILLFGMPGTGKTMLAGAIAKECGLNLISVKGPELLSKYIGASEEAVRNVFEKAQHAKPCVLFFDEFDSLAPRRGHDSTGVTDRVVNQLLTHLDGIEGREGVAVVAASSRPDLLDPALLRPGRLDKSLLCPLPNENEREEILKSLCRVHQIDSESLDLKTVVTQTSGFTGADLNAILMQARMNAVEEALEKFPAESPEIHSEVTQKHLIKSVKATKPSLLTSEKAKYNRIYAKFTRSESYQIDQLKHQKATLA